MSPVGVALAVLIGVSLGFFGGGGSILTVPLLVYVFGLPPKQAIASSLLVVAGASVSAAVQHARKGNVELSTALLFGGAGMAGAYAGGRAAAFLDGTLLLLLFAAMMAFTAVGMWRGRSTPAQGAARHAPVRLVGQGLSVGAFTGLVGAGGGFLIVPALALWAGLPMPKAVGTSLAVIVMNCLAGYVGTASHERVPAALVAWVTVAAIAGSFLGAWLAHRTEPARLRRAFAVFVLAMSVLILVREAHSWVGTAQRALPASAPQLVFVLAMLAVGVAAGRVSRGGGRTLRERSFEKGSGI